MKNRELLLVPEIRTRLFPYMGGIIRDLKSSALIINGVEDHVHILASVASTISISDFMRETKGVSSGWVNETLGMAGRFGWQTGYAAFSVSRSHLEDVRKYIATQAEHHRRMTFQQEYLAFLKRHEIEYDPRFVFEGEFLG
jgi:REP element-mobilizing transposase RayT